MTQKNTSSTPESSGRWIISNFGRPGVLRWEEVDFTSELDKGSALIRIITAGIAGTDNLQRVGGYPNERCSKPGFTPGYDFVGEIVALGSNATHSLLTKGDRVTALCTIGAHATHIVMPLEDLIRIEPSDDPAAVCALPLNYMTAYGMLMHSGVHLPPGSTVLIGSVSGGVGTAMAQLINAFDLGIKMIGTCSPSKFEFVRSLGVIPVDRNAPDLAEQVRAHTAGGKGVDVACDAVGSDESLRMSHEAAKADVGKVLVIGVMSEIKDDGNGLTNGTLDPDAFLQKLSQPWMTFFSMDRDWYYPKRQSWVSDFHKILAKVREGSLVPAIARYFRLSQAVEANQELVVGTNVKGKMVFLVDEDLASERGI